MVRLAALITLALAAGGGTASTTPAVKVELTPEDPLAVCLDGSPAVYYISKGTNPKGLYIYHQGGGWCQTEEECAQRAATALGSSKSYPPTKDLRTAQTHVFMTRDAALNPLMHDWTYVWLPYCDGGSFAGDAAGTGARPLQFRGKRIRQALIASLRAGAGFGAATDVVVGGCSAGGAATYFHADWYTAQAPAGATVRAMPDSGWFVEGAYARDGKADYSGRMRGMYSMIAANASLSSSCTGELGYRCLFAPNYVKYVKTPLFALNSRYDASMASGSYGGAAPGTRQYSCTSYTARPCDAATVNEFGAFVASAMEQALQPPHGAFLDSCYRHCSINCVDYDIGIGGVRAAQAAASWYHASTGRSASATGATGNSTSPSANPYFFDGKAAYPCAECCY